MGFNVCTQVTILQVDNKTDKQFGKFQNVPQ
jgi:hypothetical protein